MESGTKIFVFIVILASIVILNIAFPKFITADNAQWAAIILLWLGCMYLEREATGTKLVSELKALRTDPMKSMRVASESFVINDAKGKRWAEFGFHPVDAGQDRPTLTIYDDQGGAIASFNFTEVGRMLQKVRKEMKKVEELRRQRDEEMVSDIFEE